MQIKENEKSKNLTTDTNINDKQTENDQTKEEKREIEDEESRINLLEQRLQFILWSLIKFYLNNKSVGNLKKE